MAVFTEPDTITRIVRKNVVDLRKKRGISQSRLAAMMGWKQSRVSRFERGRAAATIKTICLLSHALDVPVDDLMQASARVSK